MKSFIVHTFHHGQKRRLKIGEACSMHDMKNVHIFLKIQKGLLGLHRKITV
jgi:hypothetical protein